MSEAFSLKKFFDLSPVALGKSLSIGWKIVLIGLLAFTIYKAWFVPKQKQTQQITIESGGQATIIQKQDGKKRFIIPFLEGGAEKQDFDKWGTYVRFGLRIEI